MKTVKRGIDDFVNEIDGISVTLSAIAYSILYGASEELDLSKRSTADILFSLCNHLNRINEDLSMLEEKKSEKPMKMTETTIKTLYL